MRQEISAKEFYEKYETLLKDLEYAIRFRNFKWAEETRAKIKYMEETSLITE